MQTSQNSVECSLRSADVFPVVASLPPKIASLIFGGRETTTANMSALRRLCGVLFFICFIIIKSKNGSLSINDHFKSRDKKPPWLSVRFSPLYEYRYATNTCFRICKVFTTQGVRGKFWQIFSGCRSFFSSNICLSGSCFFLVQQKDLTHSLSLQ